MNMHPTLEAIQSQLQQLTLQIRNSIPNEEPLSLSQGWPQVGITRTEFMEEAESLVDLIDSGNIADLNNKKIDQRLSDYVRRLEFLRTHTVPQLWGGNGPQATSAYLWTLNGLRKALTPVLTPDEHAQRLVLLRKLTGQARSMEARLNDLEPRTASLGSMVERIEQAYSASEQLPDDLRGLAEARSRMEQLEREAAKDQAHIEGLRQKANVWDSSLAQSAAEAKAIVERSQTAYSAATSVGLAAAFSERSRSLSMSMRGWVAGLVIALGAATYFGTSRLQSLSELFKQPNVTTSTIVLNLLLSLFSVGAPVWFGWLATKNIGQRFRLAEDYAFKASVSRAYEGFRREAARIDKDMEAQLLASALTRLDEQPLRLVENENHGSPWHELLSSDVVKEAARVVPGFAGQMKEFARDALDAAKALKSGPSSASATKAANAPVKADDAA